MAGIFQIQGVVKSYEWGKLGNESRVAQLCNSGFIDFEIKCDVPYAELWMGTHPSGPSTIPSENDCSLTDWIEGNPHALGAKVTSTFGQTGLPFLFKVLSVRQPLSIQAHPDKKRATTLHSSHPNLYPDSNHKPEMAIALTKFELMYGFRPLDEIKTFVAQLEPLQSLIGTDRCYALLNCTSSKDKDLMKSVFTAIMTSKEEEYQTQLSILINFMKQDSSLLSKECRSVKDVFLRICNHYPEDIGCFCIFLMNYIILNPCSAIFVNANEPHCYLVGDCVECMACSDNVVRAGLTPKFKDVNTLCDILTFECKSVEETAFVPAEMDSFLTVYKPPVNEFIVDKIEIPAEKNYKLPTLTVASVVLVITGNGTAKDICSLKEIQLSAGVILFMSCNNETEINCNSDILIFRAYCDP